MSNVNVIVTRSVGITAFTTNEYIIATRCIALTRVAANKRIANTAVGLG